jgi:hypothetical protein
MCVCVNVVQCYNAEKRYVYSMHAIDCSMPYEYPLVSLCKITVHCISIFCLMILSFWIPFCPLTHVSSATKAVKFV